MTTFNETLLNKDLFDSLDQFYTDLLLKSCQGRQKFSRLLALQKVAQNVKSCSKVSEHDLFMPNRWPNFQDGALQQKKGV